MGAVATIPLPDGVYIKLHPDKHRADPALGSTDHKGILRSVVQWHGLQRNPTMRDVLGVAPDDDAAAKQEKRAAGLRFGDALHTILLDGPEAFEERYCLEPTRPDGLPATKEQITDALGEIGRTAPAMSKRKIEFQAAASMAGITTYEDWKDERDLIVAGREAISARWNVALTMTRAMFDRHSQAPRYLSKGRPEVTVIWTDENGVRLKARFDYLRVRAVVDLKTYATRESEHPVDSFISAINRLAYDLQAAHYLDMRAVAFPALVRAGKVYLDAELGDDGVWAVTAAPGPDMAFMQEVAAEPKPSWIWVACCTLGVPEIDTLEFPEGLLSFSAAQVQVSDARRRYLEFRERFGPDDNALWAEDRGLIRLTDQAISNRSMNRGAATSWEPTT